MRKMKTKLFVVLGALAALGIAVSAPEAQARPQYLKAFTETYPDLKEAAGKAKCGVCHPGKDKKERNAYGKAMGSGLTKKNEKDAEALGKALAKASEAKDEGSGKTFGELIKEGKLPN